MLALEEWAEGRFKPMAMLAQVVALGTEACHGTIHESRGQWLLGTEEADGIRVEKWLGLYRQPLQVEEVALQFLQKAEGLDGAEDAIGEWPVVRQALLAAFRDLVRKQIAEGVSLKGVERAKRWLDLYYRRVHIPWLERQLRDEGEVPVDFREWLRVPAFVFFLSVAMPCWLEYRETPWTLLLRARRGDFDSLDKLLRLDPMVEHDRGIRGRLFGMMKRSPDQHNELMKAKHAGRTKEISLGQVKFALGGLLMKWSLDLEKVLKGEILFDAMERHARPENRDSVRRWIKAQRKRMERVRLKCRLNAEDIKRLFDAVAKDRGQGLVDPDFDQQPNSVYKRLDRNARLWPGLRDMDIRRLV